MLPATRRKLRREISILFPFGLSVVVPRSVTAGVNGVLKVYGFIGDYTTISGHFGHSSSASPACNRFQAHSHPSRPTNTLTRILRLGTTVRTRWLDLSNPPTGEPVSETHLLPDRNPTVERPASAGGIRERARSLCRLDLNDPPTAVGGIRGGSGCGDAGWTLTMCEHQHERRMNCSVQRGLNRTSGTKRFTRNAVPGLKSWVKFRATFTASLRDKERERFSHNDRKPFSQSDCPIKVMPENRFVDRELQLTCCVPRYRIPQRLWTRSRRLSTQRLLDGLKIGTRVQHQKSGCFVRPNESAAPSRTQPHCRYSTPLLVSNG
jgi:hypothetical protein